MDLEKVKEKEETQPFVNECVLVYRLSVDIIKINKWI